MNRILITGAGGFVGRHLCGKLAREGREVIATVRRASGAGPSLHGVRRLVGPDLESDGGWTDLMRHLRPQAVVHLASRNHGAGDGTHGRGSAYHRVNVEGTRRLVEAGVAAGVKRFVFLSSIKAVGEGAPFPYDEQTECRPATDYGKSKLEAEAVLRESARGTDLEWVILRPPLVYGPGVGGSFLRLMKLVSREWPLPFANVNNQRSLVYVSNLVDAISRSLDHTCAAGGLFHVADRDVLSTPELLRRIAAHLRRRCRLVPVPAVLLRGAGRILRRGEEMERVLGSLTTSTENIRSVLGWEPSYSTDTGLKETCDWFMGKCREERRREAA